MKNHYPGDSGLIDPLVRISEQASDIIMAIYAKPFGVRHKADGSPVTDADIEADRYIGNALERLTPGYPVLSEESPPPPFETRSAWRRYWLVDPLDGTHGFVSRSGEFTINIALIDHHEPVLGVVYLPAHTTCFYACAGQGAHRLDPEGRRERLRVSRRARDPVRVVTSHSRRNPLTLRFIENLGDVRIERLGSALKSCRVAEGRADVYPGFSRTSEWDTAAAQRIVEEAGGRVIDLSDNALRYNMKPDLDNPRFLAVGDADRDWTGAIPRAG